EIVVVDDGSRDATFSVLARLHQREPSLRVVRLKRNFGQTAAIAAGLADSERDVVVLMGGGSSNESKGIPALLGEVKKGQECVCGWRANRRDPFLSRRLPSTIANHLVSWTTQVKLHDYGCTLKAMRRDVAKNLKLYGEMHRFIPAIAYERGAQVTELKVNHRPR